MRFVCHVCGKEHDTTRIPKKCLDIPRQQRISKYINIIKRGEDGLEETFETSASAATKLGITLNQFNYNFRDAREFKLFKGFYIKRILRELPEFMRPIETPTLAEIMEQPIQPIQVNEPVN